MTRRSAPQVYLGGYAEDARGSFAKPFPVPHGVGIEFEVREIFSSVSARAVIRGMHFQFEPDQIAKIVWVTQGAIFDVVVDLRDGDDFGAVSSYHLDARSGQALYVPSGFAHGFQALDDLSVVNYAQDRVYSPTRDAGIRWDSIGVKWPLAPTEISARDRAHPRLDEFAYRFEPRQ
jgi:dTDP-4-dehydrorhamnose 3,5-epimerase